MGKIVFLAIVCLLFGAVAGSMIARNVERQHQHTHAVMWLAQFHLERLSVAVQSKNCSNITQERERLNQLSNELPQVFPLAYAQEAEFRKHADAFTAATQANSAACVDDSSALRQVRDACDNCHRQYR